MSFEKRGFDRFRRKCDFSELFFLMTLNIARKHPPFNNIDFQNHKFAVADLLSGL